MKNTKQFQLFFLTGQGLQILKQIITQLRCKNIIIGKFYDM